MGYVGRGSSTQVLTDNASGTLPNFKAVSSTLIFQTDSGTATSSAGTITFNANSNSGSSVLFTGSSSTVDLKVTDASNNTLIGSGAGNGTLTSSAGTGLGFDALHASTIGNSNTAIGYQSLKATTGGTQNTALGSSTLSLITTGSYNIAIGSAVGSNYANTESSNILIGNPGTTAESNVIRIGTQGAGNAQQNVCFIAGITGVSVSSKNYVTINTSTGQLGSEAAGTLFQTKNQVFTSSGTYTPTAGMVYCSIECIGGGGAGGGAPSTGAGQVSVGAGGGQGEYSRGIFTAATIGASQTVTIGAAGTGASGTTGGTGGTTSVAALITSIGGSGGAVGAAGTTSVGAPGAGGTGGSGGDFRTPGMISTYAFAVFASGLVLGSPGANGQYGSGGLNTFQTTGTAGAGYGSGGGGTANSASQGNITGGAGAKGVVIIQEYIIA